MTAWSGLYDDVHTDGPYGTSPPVNKNPRLRFIGKLLRRQGLKRYRVQIDDAIQLLDGDPETSNDHFKVEAVNDALPSDREHGGVRSITTVALDNAGNYAAAQEVYLEAMTQQDAQPSTYPTDASGNGGGGKQGF